MELINIKTLYTNPNIQHSKNSNLHFYILVFSTILERCYIRGTHLPLPYHSLQHSGFRGIFLLLCPLFYSFKHFSLLKISLSLAFPCASHYLCNTPTRSLACLHTFCCLLHYKSSKRLQIFSIQIPIFSIREIPISTFYFLILFSTMLERCNIRINLCLLIRSFLILFPPPYQANS